MSTFTRTPPNGDTLPTGVTEVGGLVLHLVGLNGVRVTSQLAASSLYNGYFDGGTPGSYQGNPGTIGIQNGLDAALLANLGGGLSAAFVRITLYDGDTGAGDFDYQDQNFLLINGVNVGDFSDVTTEQTDQLGNNIGGSTSGFVNDQLHTGWFSVTGTQSLSDLFTSLQTEQRAVFQLNDTDPYDNFFDFTQGVDGGLIDVGSQPNAAPVAAPDTASTTVGQAVVIDTAANDLDVDGTIVGRALGTSPSNGTVVFNADGTATYTPNAGFFGNDSFTYTITDDDGAVSTGTVTITVNPTTPGGWTPDNVYVGTSGDNSYMGGSGRDLITGMNGSDTLQGGAGDDRVYGGDGDDRIVGGAGDDIVSGGNGNDNVLGGDGNDRVYGGDGDDNLYGNDGFDYLSGGIGQDVLRGGNGDDSLFGNEGNDRLIGDAGNDFLWGGSGNDRLEGGAGNDVYFGDTGNDTFEFGLGNDRVIDFADGSDLVRVVGKGAAITAANIMNFVTQSGSNVVIDDGMGNKLTLNNTSIADISASDFLFN